MDNLRALEAAMAETLKAGGATAVAAAAETAAEPAPAVKKLAGEAAPAAAPVAAPDEPKDYQGEFYPVVKPHGQADEKK
jgi:hypothetical protein